MNKIFHFALLSLFCILLLGCSKSKNKAGEYMTYVYNTPTMEINKENKPINLNLLKNVKYTDFYENLDSIKLIPLETTDISLIGNISRIFIVNDTIFIADYSKTKTIFAFNLQGSFLYKINKLGNGPGEYQNINMVQIDDQYIMILDWFSWKLIKYDHTGNLIWEKKTDPHPYDFINTQNDEMCFFYNQYTEKTKYQIVFIDNDLSLKETAFPFRNTRELYCDFISLFQKTEENKILYHYSFCDTIFEISNDDIIAKYDLSFYSPTQIETFYEDTKNMSIGDFNKKMIKDDFVRDFMFFEMKNVLYINYSKGLQSFVALVSKKNYKVYHSIAGDAKERVSYTPFFVTGCYENMLLASIDESFHNQLKNNNKEMFYSKLASSRDIELVKQLENNGDNPVLCFLYIKPSL